MSFKRSRQPTFLLKDLLEFPNGTYLSVDHLYSCLFGVWPGNREIKAENPGGPQRANSCSLQALIKWVKGYYINEASHIDEHLFMALWMKVAAFSDYIHNNKNISADFLDDAIRKISSHASKLQVRGIDDKNLLKSWEEIALKARRNNSRISPSGIGK